MGKFLAICTIVLSFFVVVLGFYCGVCVMLVGGITDLLMQLKAPETDSGSIGFSVWRILFFEIPVLFACLIGFVGFISGFQALDRGN